MKAKDKAKRAAAEAAYEYIVANDYIGIGTGSTVNHFIDVLTERQPQILGCVSSSRATTHQLEQAGFHVETLNETGNLPVYFDGADEADKNLTLIKGGGGALTQEKVIAAVSRRFVCMVDSAKRVDLLGQFPVPVEVIEMARSAVARQLVKLGGIPQLRPNMRTDNDNLILDVYNLDLTDPHSLEDRINRIPGVVTAGIFAHRGADIMITGHKDGNTELLER